ncbi:MAG: threonine--tRNA ligase [Candidatus Diapherotrites archaeon]
MEREKLETLWHSSSHVMADAVRQIFPKARLGIGPAAREGFYYDFDIDRPFTQEDLEKIEAKMKEIIKKNEKFEKKEISKEEAQKLFAGEPYKLELIEGLEGQKISIYSHGDFTDLCKGPHVQSTGEIKAFKLLRTAGAYWRGSEKNKMLQRIYGISFASEQELQDFLKKQKEIGERNHIKIGKDLDLFSIHPEAPGMPFFHDKGLIVLDAIVEFWKQEHRKRGYQIVSTPMILNKSLWLRSGHWDHYKDNMFFTKIEEQDFAVKPMNCPGGILVFSETRHSYRELPIKMAELGIVHRNERSGVLNGLFRVRKFTQDDAHIYCTEAQLKDEIKNVIELTKTLYSAFGFNEYQVELSTKPEKAMGSEEVWEHATKSLETALKEMKIEFKVNPGEGAFYGPKIDFHIKDALERNWQCGTIQVDFSMPEKFDLYYIGEDDKKHRPVMIHRALLGSLERFLGVLLENYGGALPLWLSPVQAKIIAIADRHCESIEKIASEMRMHGLRVETDARNESVSKKVREAQLQKIPYILVVGDSEIEKDAVTVRKRSGEMEKEVPVQKLIERIITETREKK